MRVEDAAGFADSPLVHEIDGLWELDNLMILKVLNYLLTKLLVFDPKVAEVAAAVQEDDAVAEAFGQPPPGVRFHVTDIDQPQAPPAEPLLLAQPDGAVPDV